MKKGIIFDMDGTLFDTERLYQESWTVLAEEFGQVHNPAFPKAVCGSSGESMRNIVRTYYPNVDVDAFIRACMKRVDSLLTTSVPEKPGVHEILNYVKEQGLKIAIASSSEKALILSNLKLSNTIDYFDAIVSGTEVPHGKPAPDVFLKASEMLELAPEECYVIEDGNNGVHAGAAAGCTTIMVPDCTEPTDEHRHLCAGIYGSLFEVMEAMKKGEI